MSYKSILVHVEATATAANRVRLAIDLAEKFEGHVMGLGAETIDPIGTDLGYADGSIYQRQIRDIRTRFGEVESLFKKTNPSAAVKRTWSAAIDYPARAMVLNARAADLIVTSRPDKTSKYMVASPGDLVMETGTPVLVAPAGRTAMDMRYVVVGWKDTRECRRALRDALPFLQRATMVFLVQIVDRFESDSAERGLAEIAARLKGHGVVVETEVLPNSKRSIAKGLEDTAERHSADLIVIGAYGHSRVREWALGGVTQELIEDSPKFILFSH